MRKIWVIVLLFGVVSCHFFESKEKKAQKLVNREMLEIDWNEVDNYPLFGNCDETLSKVAQKECFEKELLSHFSKTIKEFEFVLTKDIDTTVLVDFLIDQEGRITVTAIEKDRAIDSQMPEFDGIVIQSLKGLPPIAPALKRGIPVRAKFRIPIALKSN